MNKPGVYRMLSANGTIVYVGQSRVLRTRLLSYFRARGPRNKAARILRHAFQIEWEYTPTEFGALLRELRLIKLHRPHFNRAMVTDDWPRGYVALTGGAVPGLRVVARSDFPDAIAMYGPFRKVRELRDAIQTLAEFTGVRDCTIDDQQRVGARRLWFANSSVADSSDADLRPQTKRTRLHTLAVSSASTGAAQGAMNGRSNALSTSTNQEDLTANEKANATFAAAPAKSVKPIASSKSASERLVTTNATSNGYSRVAGCLRRDIGTCVAPCIGEGRASDYQISVELARGFLDGTNSDALTRATQKMFDAAERLEFEHAGSLQQRIARLTWLHERLQHFHASVDRLTFRYHTTTADGAEYVYLLRRGTVRAERVAPLVPAEVAEWNARAERIFNDAELIGADIPLHDLDEFHLVSSWFRRRPAEKAKTRYP